MENLEIQNIVSTVNSTCMLDLKSIAQSAMNVEYKPQRFSALIMRIRKPRSTALIFYSGKIVVAGTKNISDSKVSCKKFIKILYKLGFNVKFCDFKIQNIVCSYNMNSFLSLEKMHLFASNLCCYEPELFPGLILRIKKVTFLIFRSGKVIITGSNDYKIVKEVFDDVYCILSRFKR